MRAEIMLLHLISFTSSTAVPSAVTDLYAPFPRVTAVEAIAQLGVAAASQLEGGEPEDIRDVYGGNSEWLAGFEAEIASALGKQKAMFFLTGVAAQNAALAVHAELPIRGRGAPPPCLMMHDTSHLVRYEDKAYKELLGINSLIVGHKDRVLTAKDLQKDLERLANVGQGPCMILVELPQRELGCVAPPWSELVEMSRLAKQYGTRLHLDGARLWEIAPFYEATAGKSLAQVVALFDSAYVSFYKGLGALTGAMLLGEESFIEAAKPWRRRLGANPYTSMPYALSCRDAYRRHRGTFDERWRKLQRLVPLLSDAAAKEGGTLRTVPADPQCCQVHCCIGAASADGDSLREALDAARDAVEAERGVRVYGRLLGPAPAETARAETVSGGEGSMDSADTATPAGGEAAGGQYIFEWGLGPAHIAMEDDEFVDIWAAFFKALRKQLESQA